VTASAPAIEPATRTTTGEDETQHEGVDATGDPPTDSLDDRAKMGISHPNEHRFLPLPASAYLRAMSFVKKGEERVATRFLGRHIAAGGRSRPLRRLGDHCHPGIRRAATEEAFWIALRTP
jgi:hypothetical protein